MMKWTKNIKHIVDCTTEKIGQFQCLTGNTIKLIAVSAMFIDHFCKIVLQWLLANYWGPMMFAGDISVEYFRKIDTLIRFDLQGVGTIAFPLFCFLLGEGFLHTQNRKRYIVMMLVFAIISEIPFDIGLFANYATQEGTFPFYWSYQNVYFTLFLSLISLACVEYFSTKSELRNDRIRAIVLQIISVAVIALIAEVSCCDYGLMGIAFVLAFYVCRKNRVYQVLMFLLAYMLSTGNQPTIFALLTCVILLFYNGKRGKLKLKYSVYIFYPVHIIVLYFVTVILERMI